jgi:hypothetical protein
LDATVFPNERLLFGKRRATGGYKIKALYFQWFMVLGDFDERKMASKLTNFVTFSAPDFVNFPDAG